MDEIVALKGAVHSATADLLSFIDLHEEVLLHEDTMASTPPRLTRVHNRNIEFPQ